NELGIEVCAPTSVRGGWFKESHQHSAAALLRPLPGAIAIKVNWQDGIDVVGCDRFVPCEVACAKQIKCLCSLSGCKKSEVCACEHVPHKGIARRADESLRLPTVPSEAKVEGAIQNSPKAGLISVREHVGLCSGHFPVPAVLAEFEVLPDFRFIESSECL